MNETLTATPPAEVPAPARIPSRLKVLLIEDSPVDSRLLRLLLSESTSAHFELTHVERLAEGLQRLNAEHFDVVLSDLTLPDGQGFESFQRLHAKAPDTPIVVLSGLDDETLAIKAVREGAQDYLVKGRLREADLARVLHHARRRHGHQQELRAAVDTAVAANQAKNGRESSLTTAPLWMFRISVQITTRHFSRVAAWMHFATG